jgi:hypothetical protein
MADLHILIKKSSATSALRSLANHDVDCEYLVVPAAHVTAALAELTSIGRNESIYSAIELTGSGNQVNGIMVPKSAGK